MNGDPITSAHMLLFYALSALVVGATLLNIALSLIKERAKVLTSILKKMVTVPNTNPAALKDVVNATIDEDNRTYTRCPGSEYVYDLYFFWARRILGIIISIVLILSVCSIAVALYMAFHKTLDFLIFLFGFVGLVIAFLGIFYLITFLKIKNFK